MTFPLEFDLLMIGVCTFIIKKQKKQKKKTKKNKKKETKKKQKKRQKKTKKKCKDTFVSHILLHRFFFFVGFIIGGLGEIFMRNELCESSLRSFVPWIMDDMYWI